MTVSNLDNYIIASANLDVDQTLPQKWIATPRRHGTSIMSLAQTRRKGPCSESDRLRETGSEGGARREPVNHRMQQRFPSSAPPSQDFRHFSASLFLVPLMNKRLASHVQSGPDPHFGRPEIDLVSRLYMSPESPTCFVRAATVDRDQVLASVSTRPKPSTISWHFAFWSTLHHEHLAVYAMDRHEHCHDQVAQYLSLFLLACIERVKSPPPLPALPPLTEPCCLI